jgi:hypothetical protein
VVDGHVVLNHAVDDNLPRGEAGKNREDRGADG